jgi:hypothetical protein
LASPDPLPLSDGGPEGDPVPFEALRSNALIEVDPKSDFEAFLKAQALRCAEGGDAVFVFTAEGSPLHRMMDGHTGISLVLLSLDPEADRRGADTAGRVSLLTLDRPHFLTLLDSLMATRGRVHVFLDSVSSMVMALGFRETYSLLRQSIEIVGRSAGPRINAFAVMIKGTHSEAEVNTFRSMFQAILKYDDSGLAVMKPPNLKLAWTRPERSQGRKGEAPAPGEKGTKSAANSVRGFLGSLAKRES